MPSAFTKDASPGLSRRDPNRGAKAFLEYFPCNVIVHRLEKCLQLTYAEMRHCGKRSGDQRRKKPGSMRADGNPSVGHCTLFRHEQGARRVRSRGFSDSRTSQYNRNPS